MNQLRAKIKHQLSYKLSLVIPFWSWIDSGSQCFEVHIKGKNIYCVSVKVNLLFFLSIVQIVRAFMESTC